MAGYFGSPKSILQINKAQKSSRIKLFSKEAKKRSIKQQFIKYAGSIEDTKKLSQTERMQIRQKIKREQTKDTIATWLLLILLFICVGWGIIQLNPKIETSISSEEETKLEQYESKYLQLLRYGDAWIEDKKWNPAIEMYKQAVAMYPKAYEANYRLALAYSYKCKFQNFDCEQGAAISKYLYTLFPEKAKEQNIMDSIYNAHKTTPIQLEIKKEL